MHEKRLIFEQLRQGLVQIIGSYAKESGLQGKKAIHFAYAEVLKEMLQLIEDKGEYDMYKAKPIIRATTVLIKARTKKAENTYHIDLKEPKECVAYLETMLEKIQEEDPYANHSH